MSYEQDGGPAFPALRENDNPAMPLIMESDGMTLRDWFAGQALVGLASLMDSKTFEKGETFTHVPEDYIADRAYCIADAMLAEREKKDKVTP